MMHKAEATLGPRGELLVELTVLGNDEVMRGLAKSLLREVSRDATPGKLVVRLKAFPAKKAARG